MSGPSVPHSSHLQNGPLVGGEGEGKAWHFPAGRAGVAGGMAGLRVCLYWQQAAGRCFPALLLTPHHMPHRWGTE